MLEVSTPSSHIFFAESNKAKYPGLIILEHELITDTVQAFRSAYPGIQSNGWKSDSLVQVFGDPSLNSTTSDNNGTVVAGKEDDGPDLTNVNQLSSPTSSVSSPSPTIGNTNHFNGLGVREQTASSFLTNIFILAASIAVSSVL